ncbi:MAG: TPD domain-containing protein [Methanomicrobia archaeon]|nr:TPD domain-containing protein [Methanomicrobia archaeon]
MNYRLYKEIYENLNSTEDIDALVEKFRIEREVFLAILSQKIVRNVKKNYYKLERKKEILRARWKDGESITDISEEYNFSPVLTASFIFQDTFSRKKFKEYLKNPELIEEKRIKKEIKEIIEEDIVYSPKYIDLQRENGIRCEEEIRSWLLERDIRFITEKDARYENFRKTPDFLLMSPFSVGGFEVRWIESKAGFGDLIQFKQDFRGQLRPYVKLFGSGIIVYWVGHLERLNGFSNRIIVISKKFFNDGEQEKI